MAKDAAFTTDRGAVSASLTAARNEFEAFQIAIRPTGISSPVTIALAPLRSSATTTTIPVDVYREEFFDTRSLRSSYDAVGGVWPDWLVPGTLQGDGITRASTLPSAIGDNGIAYVEAFVPEQAPAGTYTGEVAVKWTEAGVAKGTSFPVQLTVQPFTIPQTSTLRSFYRLSPDAACRPYGHEYASSPGCAPIVLQFAQMGLEHRIAVDPTRAKSAPISSDFVATYEDFFNGLRRTTHYPGARLANARPTTAGAYPDVDPDFLPQWYGIYNTTSDWLGRSFYYVCDEPQNSSTPCPKVVTPDHPEGTAWPTVKKRAEASYRISPQIRRLVTTFPEAAKAGLEPLGVSYVDLIDYMTSNVVSVQTAASPDQRKFPADLETRYAEYRGATGGRRQLWWYQACDAGTCTGTADESRSGYPQLAIDVPAVMNRSMPWMTFRFGMVSELYWDVVSALGFGGLDLGMMHFGNTWGDGNLFYPGPTGPHPSLRLKLIRDGMEDYEYLKLIADPACALAIANDLYPHALAASSKDAAALLLHRKQAANKILNPTSPCPYCGPGLTSCGTACRDLMSDPSNCGTCGHVCSSGICENKVCRAVTCSPGYTDCSGTCVVLSSDPRNCGACGAVCSGYCSGGVCHPIPDPCDDPRTVCP